MCGISGIILKNKVEAGALEKDIKAMSNLIIHRGPDAEGYFLGNNFAFGHRRLSILDLSPEGNQPMKHFNSDDYVITYNGEVYNYIELREELIKSGCHFNTNTDTEVILAAYKTWGESCVSKFNGMWAFAIYDNSRNIIFCSRDRFGIKPFYYANLGDKFVFGSEIKQILYFKNERKANRQILADFLVSGYSSHTEYTFFENVYCLKGSHNLTYNLQNHTYELKRYYDLSFSPSPYSEEEAIKTYKSELMRSVKYRLRSDVLVGSCLSGGLDSSTISSLASNLHDGKTQKFKAIHAQSTEQNTDESSFAQTVANSNNIELNIIKPSTKDFTDAIEEVCYTQEEPFGGTSIFMQYFVMKKAKEIGCKVMLDGQGGDETLLGYERYYPAHLLSLNFKRILKEFYFSYRNSRLSFISLFLYCIFFVLYPIRIQALRTRNRHLNPEFLKNFYWVKKNARCYLSVNALQKIEIQNTQLPHLLNYEDKNSMRNSIEARLPFLDYKVLETAVQMQTICKIKNGWTKYALRKAMEGLLPDSIIWRKNKLGFNAPDNTWLNYHKEEMIKEINKSELIKCICSNKTKLSKLSNKELWKLYSVAVWARIYSVSF